MANDAAAPVLVEVLGCDPTILDGRQERPDVVATGCLSPIDDAPANALATLERLSLRVSPRKEGRRWGTGSRCRLRRRVGQFCNGALRQRAELLDTVVEREDLAGTHRL